MVGLISDIVINYGGTLLGVFATALASYHFKDKEALRKQVSKQGEEIAKLQTQVVGERDLLSQKLNSLDSEIKDVKHSIRCDTNEIKDAIKCLSNSLTNLVEKQGELSGTLSAVLRRRSDDHL